MPCIQAQDILNFLSDQLRPGTGQINLVDDGDDIQIMLHGQINIGQGLCLNPLCGIHHEDGSLTGSEASGNLIGKVHMPGCINQVQNILLPGPGLINQAYRLGLDGNTPFPLQVHGIQHLFIHFPFGQHTGLLHQAVGKGRFPMVNMCNNTKITNPVLPVPGHIRKCLPL